MAKMQHSKDSLVALARDLAEQLGRQPTSSEFIQATGVSSSTLARHWGGWRPLIAAAFGPETGPDLEQAAVRIHKLREKAKSARGELQAVVKDLERRCGELEEANAFLLTLDELADTSPAPIREAKSSKRRTPEATYFMAASDWHMGERVRPEQVGHRNEYNPDIAQDRAEQFFKSNLVMLQGARSLWRVNQGVLWLGGDLMTGYIHEEYEADNFLSPTEEALLVFDTLIRGIDFLLNRSDLERIVIPTSNGNHGRTGRKKRITDDFRNSYEYMLYRLLERHYRTEPRIQFQIAKGYHNDLDVYGFKVRFSHGDALRSGGGVGGLAPALYRRLGKLAAGGYYADLDVQGHFHTLDFIRRFVRNGSLIGYNAFADFIGAEPEPPMQASFVIDAKNKLVSNMNPILVTK